MKTLTCAILAIATAFNALSAKAVTPNTTTHTSVTTTPQREVINMVTFGADNTGKVDCADLVRKAQEKGDVYFPAGTYLMSAVDVLSNRKYYGDGMDKTIIKGIFDDTHKVKTVFGISTYDYDGSKHPDRNVENVEISNLTLDFNFNKQWIDYFCTLQFKGKPGKYIKNITFNKLGFIDNAKCVHPDSYGGHGKDAWCVNFSSYCDSTTDILVENCVSKAESHQFVSGGGSVLKRVKVLNNYTYKPQAMGIAFTTVSQEPADFEDFEVSGNTIDDASGSSILFGHDPSPNERAISKQTFKGLRVTHNTIILSNYTVYGKSYRTKKSYPFIFDISGSEPYMTDLLIQDNNIIIKDDYSGGNICFAKLRTYTYNRPAIPLSASFQQPAVNQTVTITVASPMHKGKSAFQPGGYIAINNGGVYKIVAANGNNIDVALQDIGSHQDQGKTVATGNNINFLGGELSDVRFINNKVTGNLQTNMSVTGVIDNLTFTGNDNTNFILNYANSIIRNSTIENNHNFSFVKTAGYFHGKVGSNGLLPAQKGKASVRFTNGISTLTNMAEKTDIKQ